MGPDDTDASVYPFTPPPPNPGTFAVGGTGGPPPGAGGTNESSGRVKARRRGRLGKTAASLAVVLGTGAGAATVALASTGGGASLASADSTTTTTSTSTSTTTRPPAPLPPGRRGPISGGPASGPWALFGPGAGPGPLLGTGGIVHGTFTVKKDNGTYETIGTQAGTAGPVGATSITVKSPDGFEQSYDVSPSTIVDAEAGGIASVKAGDQVRVEALVNGSTMTAERIVDITQLEAKRAELAPNGAPGGPPSASSPRTWWQRGPLPEDDGPGAPPPAA